MDLATVMSIVQTVLTALQCSHQLLKDLSFPGYKSEIKSLQSTLNTVSAVLQDAEARQDALSEQQKQYVEELKDAVYDVDDVLDEFTTLVQRKKLILDGPKVSDKVMSILSQFRPLAFKLSNKVKEVRKKLEGIASTWSLYSFDDNYQSIKYRKEESCSYVYANDIIGRDADVENIVGMLLDSDAEHNVSSLSVVGMGGLGKTALAQLVYNDPRVIKAFPLLLWVCVSDEDSSHLDLEAVLRKILGAATGNKNESSTYEDVQRQLRGRLDGTIYLLVLDDVWNENRDEWMKLSGFLMGGQKGSRIMVTTRSGMTAGIIGNGPTYNLQGLSEEDSWKLFEKVAFDKNATDDLVSIGDDIVKSCGGVPLAIRAIGSLLYGQPKSKWLSLQAKGLAKISEAEHDIKPILKLSYYHLKSPLKSCFTYCALFSKDRELDKQELISLWMAQGYIMPEEGREVEDIAEEYFLVLVRRCFFQDVEKDDKGDILRCKMHDLMHDIAQEVAGNEISTTSGDTLNLDAKVRHLGLLGHHFSDFSLKVVGLRSYIALDVGLFATVEQFPLVVLLANCVCLRTLNLRGFSFKCLPESIGKLLHLRYLNLSFNQELEGLPEAVTKLHNLQTLDLRGCRSLKEWPKDMSKLINLRVLDINYCYGLTYMPMGLSKLTGLHTLSQFVMGHASGKGKRCDLGDLEDMKPLNNLKGRLGIKIGVPEKDKYCVERLHTRGRGGYLRDKQHLNEIFIIFKEGKGYGSREYEEVLLDNLQPHPNLKELWLGGYKGVRMPRWPSNGEGLNSPSFHLPHLVDLFINNCGELRSLSCVGGLPLLKYLNLCSLREVEYVEEGDDMGSTGEASASSFPSLVKLVIKDLPKLKGMWRRSLEVSVDSTSLFLFPSSSFPLLKKVVIYKCPEFEMTFISSCPLLESLMVDNFQRLENIHSNCLVELIIHVDNEVESVGEMKDLYQGSSFPNLRTLRIWRCRRLRSVKGWIEHLSALEELRIESCPNLVSNKEEEENDGIPWQHLPPTLHSLELGALNDMESLPKGVQYCTSLHSLTIYACQKLKSLPTWMPNLTSLTNLEIRSCSEELVKRCKNPSGEDWPLIHHIPFLNIS